MNEAINWLNQKNENEDGQLDFSDVSEDQPSINIEQSSRQSTKQRTEFNTVSPGILEKDESQRYSHLTTSLKTQKSPSRTSNTLPVDPSDAIEEMHRVIQAENDDKSYNTTTLPNNSKKIKVKKNS